MRKTVLKLLACLLAALILASMPLAVSAAENAADTEVTAASDTQLNEIPLIVIIASFDANGNGFDDYDQNEPDKLYSNTNASYYGEQWARTIPSNHWNTFFGETGYTVTNYFTEMTCGHITYIPAVIDNPDPSWDIKTGVIAVSVAIQHPTASGDAAGAIRAIISACDPYINFAKFDKNGDKKVGQNELGIVILNSGSDHAYSGKYKNESDPRGYFSVHGTSQQTYVTMDGITITPTQSGGNVTNMGEYRTLGNLMTIGVICHELAHNLGAEDLYNRNSGGGGTAVTGWPQPYFFSLQCLGNCIGSGSRSNGTTPSYLDPYQRELLGWVEEEVVSDGTYTLYSTLSGKYKVLRVNTPDPNEYYLIEVRLKEGFESNLTTGGTGGIMVWHIDESINSKYYESGEACSSYIAAGESEQHDPGIVPLFRTGWNELGTRMDTKDPSDPYYYLSSDSSTAIFDSSNYRSPLNGSVSLNSYPSSYVGTRTYNLHIEVLSEPGQEMQIKITTENNAKLAPICTAGYTAVTLDSISLKCNVLAINGPKLTKYGFIYSTDKNPTLENGKYVEGTLASDGSFSATVSGLASGTQYYFVACIANEYAESKSSVSYAFTSQGTVVKDYFLVRMYKNLGGTQRATEVKVKLGATLTYSFPMVKEGYVLEGWYTDEALTEKYDMNHTETSFTTITLYAKWIEDTGDIVTTPAFTTAETTTSTTAAETVSETSAETVSTESTTVVSQESTQAESTQATSAQNGDDTKGGSTVIIIAVAVIAVFALAAAYYFFIFRKKKQK